MTLLLLLSKHLVWSRSDGRGGTITYYYSDETTWVAAALLLLWLAWILLHRFQRLRAMRRAPRNLNRRALKRVVKRKRELTSIYLRPGFSGNIHAVGIGRLSGDYAIQIFVSDAANEILPGAAPLPRSYRGVPLVFIEMPPATFLSAPSIAPFIENTNCIRDRQEVILGGISGAHAILSGQTGTIGYFCTRRSKLLRHKETYLLSNSHVFTDLSKPKIDDRDLIVQPSPGETAGHRPIASLFKSAQLTFDNDSKNPNHVDAAIARLWAPQQLKTLIPMIGAVKGYVRREDVDVGEPARKFGRTTGYTEGTIFSIYLDIRIRYDRTGQSAFFKDQFLIEPSLPRFTKFVSRGDSGSLVVDSSQHALGLIFAGMSELPEATQSQPPDSQLRKIQPSAAAPNTPATPAPPRIESYGVANPISEVLDRLKIDLLLDPSPET
jgi:hypothetical protein